MPEVGGPLSGVSSPLSASEHRIGSLNNSRMVGTSGYRGIRGWLQTALIKTLIKRNLEKYVNSALGCSQNVVIASHDSD